MPKLLRRTLIAVALSAGAFGAQAQSAGQLNIICSVQAEWCSMIGTSDAVLTGAKINIVRAFEKPWRS